MLWKVDRILFLHMSERCQCWERSHISRIHFFPGILESMIFVAKNFPVSLLGYVWPFSFRCRAFQDISIHREIVAMRNLSDFIEADEVVRM